MEQTSVQVKDKKEEKEKEDDNKIDKFNEANGMIGKSGANDTIKIALPEKLDELSSLEQEIAMMHSSTKITIVATEKVHTISTIVPRGISASSSSLVADENKMNQKNHVDLTPEQALEESGALLDDIGINAEDVENERVSESSSSALEDIDLIAVLKGTDSVPDQQDSSHANSKNPHVKTDCSELDVGVTIEGEGEFEIMEIVDDDDDHHRQVIPTQQRQQHNPINVLSKEFSKSKMSPEEERAVAMEQIANLRSINSRRKQEMKQTGLLNTLNDDWNENDSGTEPPPNTGSLKEHFNQVVVERKAKLEKKSREAKEMPNSMPATAPSATKATVTKSETKTQTLSTKDNSSKNISETRNVVNIDPPNASTNSADQAMESSSGFKRKRVIKRKIIWDPDVPDTSKSYSQYAATTRTTPTTHTAKPVTPTASATTIPKSSTPTTTRKEAAVPKQPKARSATPKEQQYVAISVADEVQPKRSLTPAAIKRRSQTPSLLANGSGASTIKKKKVSSEIDRLMGDEGAASMILDVEQKIRFEQATTSEETQIHKPVMRNRAYTINEKPIKLDLAIKKESSPPKAKRAVAVRARASDTWDYVYQQRQNDDSMIIRRRSSSYSSTASLRRLSIDKQTNISDNETPSSTTITTTTTTSNTADNNKAFKFVKPVIKLSSGLVTKLTNRSTTANNSNDNTIASDMKSAMRASTSTTTVTEKPNIIETVTIRPNEKVAQVVINVSRTRLPYTFGVHLLNKLVDVLSKLAKSDEYNTVVISGFGGQICHGIDFLDMANGSVEKRKNNAAQLAAALKSYLKTLVTFPKPIVLAVNGNVKNLGLMQLPLFDYIVGSDRCTFEVHYAKIGQVPEGLCMWQDAPISNTVRKRLFLLGERLTLAEFGGISGLINKTTASSKVIDEALAVAKKISETSADNYYNCIKKYTMSKHVEALKTLNEEIKTIAEQWTTNKMFEKFKRYTELGHF